MPSNSKYRPLFVCRILHVMEDHGVTLKSFRGATRIRSERPAEFKCGRFVFALESVFHRNLAAIGPGCRGDRKQQPWRSRSFRRSVLRECCCRECQYGDRREYNSMFSAHSVLLGKIVGTLPDSLEDTIHRNVYRTHIGRQKTCGGSFDRFSASPPDPMKRVQDGVIT